jgi:hypothetical protein
VSKTWEDVLRWASAERQAADAVVTFLLEQLAELIELTGVAGFTGLRISDFEFFEAEAKTWGQQAAIKGRLRALVSEVLAHIDPSTRDSLGTIQVHQFPLSAYSATAQTNWREQGVNIDLGIDSDGVTLNLTGWLTEQAKALQLWLLSDEGESTVRSHEEFAVAIYQRRAYNYERRGTGARPWWQIPRQVHVATIPAATYQRQRLQEVIDGPKFTDVRWERPAYHLRRRWHRDEAVSAGRGLCTDVAHDLTVLAHVKDRVNAPFAK